jgi:hypothetical protein
MSAHCLADNYKDNTVIYGKKWVVSSPVIHDYIKEFDYKAIITVAKSTTVKDLSTALTLCYDCSLD